MQTKSSTTADVRHVNYQSDFRVVFSFPEDKLPEYPWRLELSTPNTAAYSVFTAYFDGDNYHNCKPQEDGTLLVPVDNHDLAPGVLTYKINIDDADADFPDGFMNVTIPGTLAVELWTGPSDEFAGEIGVVVLPVKGDTGPQGEQGPIGPEGPMGPQGPKGDTPVLTANPDGTILSDGVVLTDVLKVAAENSDTQTARVEELADNPPKIVEVNGMAYWAFYDLETQQYVTSQYRADDGTIVQQVEGADVSLDVVGGTMYVCGKLTSLTIASVENSTKPSIIRFTSGATATQFSYPEDFNITGWTKPEENKSYTICILFGAGNMTYDE